MGHDGIELPWSAMQYAGQWHCFDFNKPAEVPDSPQPPADPDAQSTSESSDNSSSSDSSDSEVSKKSSARAAKRPKMVTPMGEPDEVMVASVSYVQHAMIGTTKDWCPYYQGRHYQAACGARLDPDRARFAQSADPGLHLVCQRPACVKAWKAMLVYPIGRLPSKKGSMQLQLWWTRRKGFFHRQGCFVLRCTPQDPLGFNSVIPEALHFFLWGHFCFTSHANQHAVLP